LLQVLHQPGIGLLWVHAGLMEGEAGDHGFHSSSKETGDSCTTTAATWSISAVANGAELQRETPAAAAAATAAELQQRKTAATAEQEQEEGAAAASSGEY